jgi:catechol 2,3-dioxygenase-like lactoylglutathione lyase family enzyme
VLKTVAVDLPEPGRVRWPEHLPVGALRVVRWSAHYDQTVIFYRDIVGLAVLETFQDSYGLDGTILGLPDGSVHLEIVRLADPRYPAPGLDQLVFYLPDAAAREHIMARLAAAGQWRRYLPGPGRAGGGVRVLDLPAAKLALIAHDWLPPLTRKRLLMAAMRQLAWSRRSCRYCPTAVRFSAPGQIMVPAGDAPGAQPVRRHSHERSGNGAGQYRR